MANSHKINSAKRRKYRDTMYEEQGGFCAICEKRMLPPGSGEHSMAPSLDHIVAKSFGGVDHPSNLQLVHMACNKRKGRREWRLRTR